MRSDMVQRIFLVTLCCLVILVLILPSSEGNNELSIYRRKHRRLQRQQNLNGVGVTRRRRVRVTGRPQRNTGRKLKKRRGGGIRRIQRRKNRLPLYDREGRESYFGNNHLGEYEAFTDTGVQAAQMDEYKGFLGGPAGPKQGAPAFSHTQNDHKNYAFAYAVRDGDNAEDFSHKEARDGKLTMGEYKVNLPDGRTQIVRYTAGPKHGFKADVTYEGDDPRNRHLTKPHKNEFNRSPSPYQHHGPPSTQYHSSVPSVQHIPSTQKIRSNRPTLSFKKADTPIYFSKPLKALQSPKFYQPIDDEDSFPSQNFQFHEPIRAAVTTPPPPPLPPAILLSSTPPSMAIFNHISSTPAPYSGPKSIYDKMPKNKYNDKKPFPTIDPDKSPRAGPARKKKPKKFVFNPTSGFHENQPYYDVYTSHSPSGPDDHNSPPAYQNAGYQFSKPLKGVTTKLISPVPTFLDPHTLVSSQYSNPHTRPDHISNTHQSRLIPEGYFKEGLEPSSSLSYPGQNYRTIRNRKKPKKLAQYHSEVTPKYPSHENSDIDLSTKKSIFKFLNPQTTKPKGPSNRFRFPKTKFFDDGELPVIKNYSPQSSLATFAAGVHPSPDDDYQSVHSQYFYGKPSDPSRRKPKQPASGLVFLETPGTGERPTAMGVENALARLPQSMTHTITHPYEVGAIDYGKNVGYSISKKDKTENDDLTSSYYGGSNYLKRRRGTNAFTPPGYHAGGFRRQYLIDDSPDSIVQASARKHIQVPEELRSSDSSSNSRRTNNDAKSDDDNN